MSRDNRIVVKLDAAEMKMLDELAAQERVGRAQCVRSLVIRQHRIDFPPRKVGAVEARRQAENARKVAMHGGAEREVDVSGRRYVFHAGLDGRVAWGPLRAPRPPEGSGVPVTAGEVSAWRAANPMPPYDARAIETVVVDDGTRWTLEAKHPEDQAEFDRRMVEKGER